MNKFKDSREEETGKNSSFKIELVNRKISD